MPYDGGWAPYVPVAERRSRALKKMTRLRKKGMDIRPIEIEGRKISKTFWGQAWCDHMESLGDFTNRLPRGRTYVRNGSVCHLAIEKGCITAMVSGSSLYNVTVKIDALPKKKWTNVKSRCAGQIGSLLELLQGRLSDSVMEVVTDSSSGIFPLSKEIRLSCSCPDWASMCKHVAAVLYGVGARLDEQPDLLFLLRGVKHDELISANAEDVVNRATLRGGKRPTLDSGDLGDVFGIELDTTSEQSGYSAGSKLPKKSTRSSARKQNKPATTRRKKSKASGQITSKSVAKKTKAISPKKKASKKKTAKKRASSKATPRKTVITSSAKKKAISKNTKKNENKKTAKKPTKKKAAKTHAHKKKTGSRTIKNSAAKKRAVKNRAQSVKKLSTRKKTGKKR